MEREREKGERIPRSDSQVGVVGRLFQMGFWKKREGISGPASASAPASSTCGSMPETVR